MTRRNHIRSRMRTSRWMADRRSHVIQSAKSASRDAKRASNALDLEYKIIKNGYIYKVVSGKLIKVSSVPKIKVEKSGFTKGSKICLK